MPPPAPHADPAVHAVALARQHLASGDPVRARDLLEPILARTPTHPLVLPMAALACALSGALDKAALYFERALLAAPDDLNLLINCSRVLVERGEHDRAIRHMEHARAIAQARGVREPAVAINLCVAYRGASRPVSALHAIETPGSSDPTNPMLAVPRATSWFVLGHPDMAAAALRPAITGNPDRHDLRTFLCAVTNYLPDLSTGEALEEHRAYGRTIASLWPAGPRPPMVPRTPGTPLRVGFVSPDLREHSVAAFLLPLLEHLDRTRIAPIAYSAWHAPDEVSAQLRAHCERWHDVPGADLNALRRLVAQDRIDILIDLAGHTILHRLPLFQSRAAPVQITYLGYPATTGVGEMDFRIVDSSTDPAGSEAHSCEALLRLDPCFLCYRPVAGRPAPGVRGADGPIRFASFNTLQKLSERVLRTWARVIEGVPGSTLTLKSRELRAEEARTHTLERCVGAGLPKDRVRILPGTDTKLQHLAAYGDVDIALDSFPYCGTTTTCEALSMGAPVVTLAGDRHSRRVGVSLLSAVGLGDLVARDEDEYVRLAVALAKDRARLSTLRAELPERLQRSPLCDARAFAARFADLMEHAWDATLAARGPAS